MLLPHRIWKVKFVGESVDDCGGGYSESIAEMCDELMTTTSTTSLLIPTPNGRDESGTSRDCFLLNPTLRSPHHMQAFRFLGILMGIAIRTGAPLSLNLAEPMWRLLSGSVLTTKVSCSLIVPRRLFSLETFCQGASVIAGHIT